MSKKSNTIVFVTDIESATLNNENYREVLFTTDKMQLVLMSLLPQEDIEFEIHQVDQFIRIESGQGVALIGIDKKIQYNLEDGSIIMIPANTYHQIINTSKTQYLKLYTIYSPPNHPYDRVDVTRPDND